MIFTQDLSLSFPRSSSLRSSASSTVTALPFPFAGDASGELSELDSACIAGSELDPKSWADPPQLGILGLGATTGGGSTAPVNWTGRVNLAGGVERVKDESSVCSSVEAAWVGVASLRLSVGIFCATMLEPSPFPVEGTP